MKSLTNAVSQYCLAIALSFYAIAVFSSPDNQFIFTPQPEHTHGSTIVELPNGDLLAAWFQGDDERRGSDVRIMGARLSKYYNTWSEPFVMADTPAFPDINPAMFLDSRGRLWLVWYTVMGNQWDTSLLKYKVSKKYGWYYGAPKWKKQDVLHVHLGENTGYGIQPDDAFVATVEAKHLELDPTIPPVLEPLWQLFKADVLSKARGENMLRSGAIINPDGSMTPAELGYPTERRLGWQTKNKAITVGDRIILPLYSDWLNMSLMAITDDFGKHWSFSEPLVGTANIQASIAERSNGHLVAYMRDNGVPPKVHHRSESSDNGETWSMVEDSQVLNPGSGSDIVTLANGNWVIAYNNLEDGRYSLVVSLSEDEGATWPYTRQLELDLNPDEAMRTKFDYPAIIQGEDGDIHITYSYRPEVEGSDSIKYRRITEAWIKQ